MKKLQVEFEMNADHCGVQTFKQLQRTEKTALYQRIRKDKTTHSFEVFRVKTVKEGAPLPNGLKVLETYESYPGKNSFGKWAYSYNNQRAAEARFEQMEKESTEDTSVAPETDSEVPASSAGKNQTSEPKRRGKKAIDRSTIKFPKKGEKFGIEGLELLNPNVSKGFLYQHLMTLIDVEYCVIDKISGGRGKPKNVYQAMAVQS